MSDAHDSWGSKFSLNGTEIAEVSKIGGPDGEKTIMVVTHLQSPGNIAEKIISTRDPGKLQLSLNWIPSDPTHELLMASYNRVDDWDSMQIEWADGTVLGPFDGTVTKVGPAVEVGKHMTADVEIEISGEIPGWVEAA